jgi:hypothetical protein
VARLKPNPINYYKDPIMKNPEVFATVSKLLRGVNAVDPSLTDAQLGRTKLSDLDWFKNELGLDPDFKRDVLYDMVFAALKKTNNGLDPYMSPANSSVFQRPILIDDWCKEIAENS